MTTRPQKPSPTLQHRPPSEECAPLGRPMLLSAFPTQVAVPIPSTGDVVGRDWLAETSLSDPEVSGRHLRFLPARDRLEIEDVGSRNGTFVDGDRIAPGKRVPLEDGAILRLGSTLLVYREVFIGPAQPEPPLGRLVAPWGLSEVRVAVSSLAQRPVRKVLLLGESGTGKQL